MPLAPSASRSFTPLPPVPSPPPVGPAAAAAVALLLGIPFPTLQPWSGPPHAPALTLALLALGIPAGARWIPRDGHSVPGIASGVWMASTATLLWLGMSTAMPFGLPLVAALALLGAATRADLPPIVHLGTLAALAASPFVRGLAFAAPSEIPSSALLVCGLAFLYTAAATPRTVSMRLVGAAVPVVRPRPRIQKSAVIAPTDGPDAADAASSEPDRAWDPLLERIRAALSRAAAANGVPVTLDAAVDGLTPPSRRLQAHLPDIVRAAAHSSLRLGAATAVRVRVARAPSGVVVELEQQDPSSDAHPPAPALSAVRRELQAVGGRAEVTRSPNGWLTRVHVPEDRLN